MMTLESIGLIVAVLLALGSLVAWAINSAIRATVGPLQTVIENNTEAMRDFRDMLSGHAEKLENHEVRIVKVETVHEMDEREEDLGRARRRQTD